MKRIGNFLCRGWDAARSCGNYAGQGLMPTIAKLLRPAPRRQTVVCLLEARPILGLAGIAYRLARGRVCMARPTILLQSMVQPFSSRTAAFDAGVLQAESWLRPPSGAARRSRRLNGPVVATGPSTARRLTTTSSRAAALPPTTSAPMIILHLSPRLGCNSIIRRASPGKRPSRAPRPSVLPVGLMFRNPTARPKKCACASSILEWISTA